jgi:hypothetical protein
MNKKDLLKKAEIALLDIIRGYSILGSSKEELYFKHFSLLDSLVFEEEYNKNLASARRSGIKDEDSIIKEAIKSKKWSIAKEEEIKSLIWSIDKLSAAAKKISDVFQRRSAEENVKSKQEALAKIQEERREICSFSAESFAETKKIKSIILSSIYKDVGFTEKLEGQEALSYSKAFFDKISMLNDSKIIATAAYNTSFFEIFSLNYRNPHVLVNKFGMEMTLFQKNLLVYANALLNKLKNVNVPESILDDPIKVLNYKEVEKDSGKKTSVGLNDLKEKSAKNGGQLNPEDFLT